VILRTWTASDQCSNSISCVQKITVRDITRPTITCPPDLVLDCPADTITNARAWPLPRTLAVRSHPLCGCGHEQVRRHQSHRSDWTATDGCSNSVSCVQMITVRDITGRPSPAARPRLECPAVTTTNATGVATAQDTCSQVTIRYSDSVTNNCGATKVIARTWTATDACGNSSSCVQTIMVLDTTRPSLICPTNVTLDCPANTSTNVTGVATAQDGCGAVTVTYLDSVTNNCGATKVIAGPGQPPMLAATAPTACRPSPSAILPNQ